MQKHWMNIGGVQREAMEKIAADHQKKLAESVNKKGKTYQASFGCRQYWDNLVMGNTNTATDHTWL